MFKLNVLTQVVAATAASSFLIGCGSGSSSGSAESSTTQVTGSAFASYVSGASVVAMDGSAEIAGPVTTSASGRFTLPIPNEHLRSELVFVATGGTYIDEVTGQETTSGELSVVAGANSLAVGSSIHATPSSTIIKMLMNKHGMTKEAAEEAFEKAFGYLPDTSVAPVDATNASDAEDASKLAGVRAAAFSQLLKNLELNNSDHAALLDALAEDLADGEIDGMNGATAVQLKGDNVRRDLAAQFSLALFDFAKGVQNKSGLNPGKVGLIKFAKKAASDDYIYELSPKGMVTEGKVSFNLTIKSPDTDGSPGVPQQGLQPNMMPVMYMAGGHAHSSPHSGCTVTDDEGVAECTVYFLMASAMKNGTVMGNWDLKFSVDDANEVHFFPKVMMDMSDDTSKLVLSGDEDDLDAVAGMSGDKSARKYYIYKESIADVAGNYTVKFFIATKESMNSFPAVNNDGAATGGLNAPVSLTVDGELASFEANGVWAVTDLSKESLSDLELVLTVNGEPKPAGIFKITPTSL